ncbi:sulfate permease, SulP family [Pseudorhodobacter antarcticus]|uniref:Sulfate permease, SulP family n=1 Tax=Pseudorhodobacter antarcticus TaxID=1077947 RepID=A0A1H8J474_9RHOB|nr:sulfate permease [Pseudorhodobacter antarcticus]SEN75401.1 sulfate permease, SulP family [Pseudorhodobacter antarcticus]
MQRITHTFRPATESNSVRRYFPILDWSKSYSRDTATSDLVAALIVTIMLIPQSLAYALLAGLPAEVGLYASILPLVIYAVFGTSRTLAVGPVAVASLMTAAAVGKLAAMGTPEYYGAAIALAFLSGVMLLGMGLLRLGFVANFLSHPVISGFVTASGLIIAAGQIPHLLGIKASGKNLLDLLGQISENISNINAFTVLIGASAIGFLFWSRKYLKDWLLARHFDPRLANVLTRAAPVAAVIVTTLVTAAFGLNSHGVAIVGDVPRGLPVPTLPPLDLALWSQIAVPALLIAVVGYVETISVAQTLAAKRRQRIDPDQELVALGACNIGSALSGGFPVTGGFSRSVVNFDAGAQTPAAGAFTAVGMALATVFLTPLLFFLPKATLAATIILAVLTLVDFGAIRRTLAYSRTDGTAMIATILVTLAFGVESGILAGVALSLFLHLYRTSRPHVAIVGQVPGTEHFRNIDRHAVITAADVLTVRVDESLYFPNARFLEDFIQTRVAANPDIRHLVLMFPAVNEVDSSALESLEAINEMLHASGVTLHLSEVKGPVMDRLRRSPFITDLTGEVFLTQYDAMVFLAPELTAKTLAACRRDTVRSSA